MAPHVAVLLAVTVAAATLLAASPGAESAMTCGQVYGAITPCVTYIRDGGTPPPVCCSGIRDLLASAHTTEDRQAACRCLKIAAQGLAGMNMGLAAGLPARCGVSIPYKISTSTDCNKVR